MPLCLMGNAVRYPDKSREKLTSLKITRQICRKNPKKKLRKNEIK